MSELVFSTFGAVKEIDASRVTVPADRAADFARAATYFSAHTNRHSLAVTMTTAAEARLLASQVRQWAEDHGMSSNPTRNVAPKFSAWTETPDGQTGEGKPRTQADHAAWVKAQGARFDGCTVTFRITKRKSDASRNGQVVTTSTK